MSRLFVNDPTRKDPRALITTDKLARFTDVAAPESRYLYASGNTVLTLLAGSVITTKSGAIFQIDNAAVLGVGNLDTGTSFTYGKDYYVYVVDTGSLADNERLVISLDRIAPAGTTVLSSRCIGGFHYGEVRNTNANREEINASGVVRGTGWESNTKTAIVPNSIWTVSHRPACSPEGMVFVMPGFWSDIYLASVGADGKPVSKYNELPWSGTEGMNWYKWVEFAARVGKRLPSYAEFVATAAGSPEGLDANNNNAWSATTNTARNRTGLVKNAVSNVNMREAVGNLWKWINEFIANDSGTGAWQDPMAGQGYGKLYLYSPTGFRTLVAGGYWGSGAIVGARTVYLGNSPWDVGAGIGALLGCDSLESDIVISA